jgi:GDPmannose 4,6-dehydratase
VARIYHAIKNNQSFEPIELGNLDAKRDWSHAEDFVDGIWKMLNQEEYNLKSDFEEANFHYQHDGQNEKSLEWERQWLSKHIKEYVLSSQETHSIREFIELAFKEAGVEGNWSFQGTIGGYVPPENEIFKFNEQILVKINPIYYRPADVEILLGNSTKAREELGWKPKVSFKELVSRMVQNDIKNFP